MKAFIKYIVTLSLVALVGFAFGQGMSQKQAEAEAELLALQTMDKNSMSKAEKKAWKKQKRYWKRIIALEEEKGEQDYYAKRALRYGPPYGYNPYYYGYFGYPIYGPAYYRLYQRPIVIIRQRRPVHRYSRNH